MPFTAPNNIPGPKKKITDHTPEELRAAISDARALFGDALFYKMLYGIDAYMRLRDLTTAEEMERFLRAADDERSTEAMWGNS